MIECITLAYKHGAKTATVLIGPDKPYQAHKENWKAHASQGGVHPEYELLELWESGSGITKTLKLSTPEAAKAREESNKALLAKRAEHVNKVDKGETAKAPEAAKAEKPAPAPKPKPDTDKFGNAKK